MEDLQFVLSTLEPVRKMRNPDCASTESCLKPRLPHELEKAARAVNWNIELYSTALEFATIQHKDQTYGGRHPDERIPYVNHLASVAAEVLWGVGDASGMDIDLAIPCALLHDVLEDTPATFKMVAARFGDPVACGVQALTKDASLPSAEKLPDSLARIGREPQEVWVVKLADRISNLYHPPYYWNDEKIRAYREESRLILDALGSANQKLADRLAHKIAQ